MTDYFVYDVFTKTPFGGNQLAVFPDARALPAALLQKIAAEFNYSEVVFVYPPREPRHAARLRIFTPTSEVDFAGHPLIGTIVALTDLGYTVPMTLELGVGPILCDCKDALAEFTTAAALETISNPDPDLVARALGLPAAAIKTQTHAPVQASLGLTFVIAELDSRASLAACQSNIDAVREGARRYPAGIDFAIFAYVRDGSDIDSRMFAPLDNITEDPATGSASATLAALLTESLDAPQTLKFLQGEDMGRPSYINARTQQNPLRVTISGTAVKTMAGKFVGHL